MTMLRRSPSPSRRGPRALLGSTPGALLATLLLSLPGCLTCAMWEELDRTRSQKVARVVLTPVTVAVDAALFAGYVYVESCGGNCGGCRRRCR